MSWDSRRKLSAAFAGATLIGLLGCGFLYTQDNQDAMKVFAAETFISGLFWRSSLARGRNTPSP